MIALFASAGLQVSREQVSQWLKKDDDINFVNCMDSQLAYFLNGFINEKRGKKEGPNPVAEKRLSNNIILTKLKIALNLKAEELIALLGSVDFRLNKPELSAFSRKTDHKHYRECKDQVLRNLLQAIDKKYHVERTSKFVKESADTGRNTDHKTNYKGKSSTKKSTKSISQKEEPFVEGARPNASAIYVNPNKKQSAQDKTKRGVLKLRPEDIYKQPSKKS
ncbi:DUF1456 family protein [Candidatus Colwellia aromaticivorans]|uniref:DUF1456 family protein n=1 Tax=Candidatus Colwellia aromaticivorans TaxID=2267621 RepID=UPI003CCC6C66